MSYATNEKLEVSTIYKMILEYRTNLIAANKLKNEYISVIAGGSIAQYGIESSMPKAAGGTSDPTFNEITRLIKQDTVIDRFENKVRYIQNRWDRILKSDDEVQAIVFHLALSGNTITDISETTGYSRSKVRNNLMNCAEMLQD